MSEITAHGEKKLVLAAGRAHPELAKEIAKELGTELLPLDAYDFANGEIYVRAGESVRGTDAFVIQAHPAPLNNWLMEQLIMIDSLKRASAKRITVVSPFYPYARQDKKSRGREPISARLVADLYKTAGADRIMSVDLHTSQIQGFFDGPVDHLMAIPLLADYIRTRVGSDKVTVVSPDTGRVRVAERGAKRRCNDANEWRRVRLEDDVHRAERTLLPTRWLHDDDRPARRDHCTPNTCRRRRRCRGLAPCCERRVRESDSQGGWRARAPAHGRHGRCAARLGARRRDRRDRR